MSIPGILGLVGNDARGIYRLAAADTDDGAEDVGSYANRRDSHYRGGYTTPSTNLRLQPDGPWWNEFRGLQYEVQISYGTAKLLAIRSPSFQSSQQVKSD